MRVCSIITNPGAGSYSAGNIDALCKKLADAKIRVELSPCGSFSDMTAEAAQLAALQDNRIIAAAGGDGTINAVFNGLVGKKATCAIIPMGTANVMAIEMGILNPLTAATRIISGATRPLTAGLIKNEINESRFFLMAGAGYDGEIVRGVTLKTKKLLGKGAYGLSALRSLIAWDSSGITVNTGSDEFTCHSLIVCNSSRYGGSFQLAPKASLFSPVFDLVAIMGGTRRAMLGGIAGALTAKNHSAALYRTTASTIIIKSIKPVQADGDDWGDSPVVITAEPDYAEIIV